MKRYVLISFCLICLSFYGGAQDPYNIYELDGTGDGIYTNPIIHADYSDPDVIRVGDDYYMAASSFNCVPGLPVLHSKDLVNWELTGYALPSLQPDSVFSRPVHGGGVWAPCIRWHNNEFYIYYPDPDQGIFLVRAKNPAGPWSEAVMVRGGKGLIDPSPLWDDDGRAYLVHAFAGSRAGIKSILVVCPMNPEGTKVTGDAVMPSGGRPLSMTLPQNDEFNDPAPGLQWQWHANPRITWGLPVVSEGYYRLNCIPRPENFRNLWDVPNLLLQKFPAEEFTTTTSITFNARFDSEEAGLLVMGLDYQYISIKRIEGKLMLRLVRCIDADKGSAEEVLLSTEIIEPQIVFRVNVAPSALCSFSYSTDGKTYMSTGETFSARAGQWIGAKIGLFALRDGITNDAGSADIDWFRIEKKK